MQASRPGYDPPVLRGSKPTPSHRSVPALRRRRVDQDDIRVLDANKELDHLLDEAPVVDLGSNALLGIAAHEQQSAYVEPDQQAPAALQRGEIVQIVVLLRLARFQNETQVVAEASAFPFASSMLAHPERQPQIPRS